MNIINRIRGCFLFVWVPLVTIFCSMLAILTSLVDRRGNLPHRAGRLWARLILSAAGVNVQIIGFENIDPDRSAILAANHQSQFDIPAVLGYLPIQFRWLAKKELFKVPLWGYAMRRAGYMPIDRSHPKKALRSLEEAAKKIRNGTSILIFPEGTRSCDGKLLPFKPGAIVLALKSGCPIVPMAIVGTRETLPRGSLWAKPGDVKIRIGKAIETTGSGTGHKDLLSETLRRAIEELMGIKTDSEKRTRGDTEGV